MPPPYKFVYAPGFADKQRDASIDLQLELGLVLRTLARDPVPDTKELRALPLKDSRIRNAFTVTFADGDAMLTNQILRVYRIIGLVDLIWDLVRRPPALHAATRESRMARP
jgi:hypothetical protein